MKRFFFGLRFLLLLSTSATGAPLFNRAGLYEVTVYSCLTDEGKNRGAPTAGRPLICQLGRGGYREIGPTAAGEHPLPETRIDALVADALQVNHFRARSPAAPPPDLLLAYHWGCVAPWLLPGQDARLDDLTSAREVLAIVGGAALRFALTDEQRTEILRDALDERYFLDVSAYDYAAYAAKTRTLLWRTQVSVPIAGLTQEQAMPLLAATGAAFFDRETQLPQHIGVEVAGVLRGARELR